MSMEERWLGTPEPEALPETYIQMEKTISIHDTTSQAFEGKSENRTTGETEASLVDLDHESYRPREG